MDRDLPLRGDGQLQRAVVPTGGGVEALAIQQPADLPCHGGEALDRLGELDIVQPLGKWRAPSAESQHEPVGRRLGKTGGQHRDGGR
ncbi:MAG: hypothetical protein ABIU87_04130 [Ornithinibacter sp.]